ncbi:hypothetical protein BGW38_000142 [Lunasporangiospora selenospora]|uniref:Transmembrane protein 198 n=1 Tax=Lunasporangiospora selenospora TaxID=979761 RepID=A0A9P6KF82_9FUNG|nr:hypothetical protein BGW38_000142 [Lunasporangiospora selenospora]
MGTSRWTVAARWKGILQLLFFCALPILAKAQQPDDGSNDGGTAIELTWERIVAGLVLMLIGVIFTFRGYRHFNFTMFLAGFIAGCVIVYSVFINVEPTQGWNYSQIIYVFGCIGGGLILGTLCFILHRYTAWLLGAVTGLTIALYILAWRSGGLIRSKGGRIGLLAGASALGVVIGLIFGRRILIPASAIVGAYIFVVGLDLFARTGFSESIAKFFTTNSTVDYQLNTNLYIMLGSDWLPKVDPSMNMIMTLVSWAADLASARTQPTPMAGTRSLTVPVATQAMSKVMVKILLKAMATISVKVITVIPLLKAVPATTTITPAATGAVDTSAVNRPSGLVQDEVYTEKAVETEPKSWNPFKKNRTGTTVTTTTLPNDELADNRVSYSSNTALNQ